MVKIKHDHPIKRGIFLHCLLECWSKFNLSYDMKFAHALSLSLAVLMISCGDSSTPDPSLEKTDSEKIESTERLLSADAPTLPEKKISQDGWVGTFYTYKSDFKEVFEDIEIPRLPPPGASPEFKTKRDENDTGLEPVNIGRLRLKAENAPYTGKIYQHFLSGEIQHYATYLDGVREGRAFWWRKDGNLTKVSEGWGYNYQEIHLETISNNPGKRLTSEMNAISPELAEPTSFAGIAEEWKEWATVNSEGITFCLSTGVYLDGVVKIYANEGHLDTVRRYKDGFLEGEFASYHANGTQSQSIQYKAGKKHGKEIWWQDNGYKSYSANFLDDQLHGKTYNWDDQGYLISSSEFDMGKPMRPVENVSAPAKKVEQ